jgi:hypothetical protein
MFIFVYVVELGLKIVVLVAQIRRFCNQKVFDLLYADRKLLLVVVAGSWVCCGDDFHTFSVCAAIGPKWRLNRFTHDLNIGLIMSWA